MKKTKLLLALCFAGCMANSQTITTVAGNGYGSGSACSGLLGGSFSGDGGQATAAELYTATGVAVDAVGNLYIADQANSRIRKVNTSGIISTIAGNGTAGFSGDGGQATAAKLSGPAAVTLDAAGNLYIADEDNQRIRKVSTSGIISTVAGNGTGGFSGDGAQATAAELTNPIGVAFDATGNLYIADSWNNRIRKVTTGGVISTYAGNGTGGFSGDGGQATAGELNTPQAMGLDALGNLYIADYTNNRVRKVTTTGIISTFVGNGTYGFSGDGGAATAAELKSPVGIIFDVSGNLYIADSQSNRIRKVTTAGIISTFAGNGTCGYSGDGGQATAGELNNPNATIIDTKGNFYIADSYNNVIRKISPCVANAGPNVNDYDNGDGMVCTAVSIGTASVSGMSYAWSPTTALSCTNCAQPNTSYDNLTTPQIYTLTVSGSGCITATSTVQVTTLTPALTATLTNPVYSAGVNISVVANYTANFTPTYYYMGITRCNADGSTYTGAGAYSWDNGWGPVEPSGYTFTFPNTNTLTCNTYYSVWFATGNSNVCNIEEWAGTPLLYTTLPANAGSNQTNQQDICGHWTPGVTIGTPAVSGMGYSWSPTTNLNPTNTATATSTYSTTMSSQTITYTLTVSKTGCTSVTSTVNVTAEKNTCMGCCREASGIATQSQATPAFVVYPNPSSGQVTISLYDKADYIQLIDMQGRLIYEAKDIDAQDFKLDISKYNNGIYFIRAKIGDNIEKQKLVVE